MGNKLVKEGRLVSSPERRKTRRQIEREKAIQRANMYRISDTTKALYANGYDSFMNDTFIYVKTVPEARTQLMEMRWPQSIVMRERDSRLFYISESELVRSNIKTVPGNKFVVRLLTPTGYDKDLYLRFTEIGDEQS
jgi:hypothetical protein